IWQMLLKGITEAQAATRPAAAAEMVLVRIAYVADMPTPDEAIKMLEQNGGAAPAIAGNGAPRSAPAPGTSSMQPATLPASICPPRARGDISTRPPTDPPMAEPSYTPAALLIAH